MLKDFRKIYAPLNESDELDPRFTLSLQKLDYVDYLFDALLGSTEAERADFIKRNSGQLRRYYESLKSYGYLSPALTKDDPDNFAVMHSKPEVKENDNGKDTKMTENENAMNEQSIVPQIGEEEVER